MESDDEAEWSDPPEEAYGRVSDPQRYAPLLPLTTEIARGLEARFAVSVEHGADPQVHLFRRAVVVECVRIVPDDPRAAPLVLATTDFPGVMLRAGAWTEDAFPRCGCDACAENPQRLAEELRLRVAAVTAGRLREQLIDQGRAFATKWWGQDWGNSYTTTLSKQEAAALRAYPVAVPPSGTWHPWPARRMPAPPS